MKSILIIIILLIITETFAQIKQTMPYKGKEIIITLKNNDQIEGELICIKDSIIFISVLENRDSILNIQLKQIKSVKIINDSNLLASMGNGFAAGASVGALLGLVSGDDNSGFIKFSSGTKALIGGASLGLVGAVIGIASSSGESEDIEIIVNSIEELKFLTPYSRDQQALKKSEHENFKPIPKESSVIIVEPEIRFNKRYDISIFLGTSSSGPADQIKNQMISSKFNHSSYNFFSKGQIIHPVSLTGLGEIGTPWLLSLKYYYTKTIMFGAFYSTNPIGMTSGYNNQFGYFILNYSVNTIAAMAYFKYKAVSLGAGPAIYFSKTWQDLSFYNNNSYSKTKLGLVFELGLTSPTYSVFYVSAIAQYRLVGNTNIGPFKIGYPNNQQMFPSINVSYNHYFIAGGMGIRL